MRLVPGGVTWQGALPGETDRKDELPGRVVAIDPFYVDETEVTRAQFARFVEATGYVTDAERRGGDSVKGPPPGRLWVEGQTWRSTPEGTGVGVALEERLPVTLVTWYDAVAYCQWLGAELPTESQFEYLLRGGWSLRRFPWGDESPPSQPPVANLPDLDRRSAYPDYPEENFFGDYRDGFVRVAPVARFPPDAFGLFDVWGNVREWCQHPSGLYGGPVVLPRRETRTMGEAVARGPCFSSRPRVAHCSWRHLASSHIAREYIGFRCVLRCPIEGDGRSEGSCCEGLVLSRDRDARTAPHHADRCCLQSSRTEQTVGPVRRALGTGSRRSP